MGTKLLAFLFILLFEIYSLPLHPLFENTALFKEIIGLKANIQLLILKTFRENGSKNETPTSWSQRLCVLSHCDCRQSRST
ncbi:hypothetical protein TRIP_D410132 [uncultured Paludibacter sp.]|nr:hypothetical protein TRIP_D410132 [uncultured Paludibacter sp.]